MSGFASRALRAFVMTTAVLVLAACGNSVGSSGSGGSPANPPAAGELLGQGTVLQKDGGPAEFCLGAVAESYPPQCSGPEIVGWDWSVVDQSETASGVTWGTYALQGRWDGTRFTPTRDAIPLSLYDPPVMEPDTRTDKANPGAAAGNEDELVRIQQSLSETAPSSVLGSYPENGYIFVQVVYDDGTLQDAFDQQYGPDVIAVQSALRPAG